MSHKILRPFIVKVSVLANLGYFPLINCTQHKLMFEVNYAFQFVHMPLFTG